MSISLIYFFTVTGLLLLTLGSIGLYIETKNRLKEIEAELDHQHDELTRHKRDIRIIKEREAQRSDKIIIVSDQSNGGVS